jgi:hypothetical protein
MLCTAGTRAEEPHSVQQAVAAPEAAISWPLDAWGKERITLRLPDRFFSPMDRIGAAIDSRRPPYSDGFVWEQVAMTALWPGLVTMTNDNAQEFKVLGGGREMRFLMDSAARYNKDGRRIDRLQTKYDVAVKFSTEMMCVGIMAKSHCYKRETPDIKQSEYGLQRLGVDFSKYPDFPDTERAGMAENDIYYVRASNRELLTVITCTAEEAQVNPNRLPLSPQCSQSFISPRLNALVSIGYRRIYLPDWQAIQAAWNSLLESSISAPKPTR